MPEPAPADRRVSLGMSVSLDGFVAGPKGELDWMLDNLDESLREHLVQTLRRIDTMLMGRVNYLEQAAHWPHSTDPIAAVVNQHRKVVFSSTLERVEWANTRRATGSPAEEIRRLKSQPGAMIGVSGGVRFARALLRDHLLDELRLTIHPVALGSGLPLFVDRVRLSLIDTKRFASGVVVHTYQPAGGG
ncbi:MAG TPA: dihydrofolate reductase family protein [Micromonosporaceae bacterium]